MVVKGYQRHLVKVQLAKGHLIKLFRLCVYISVWMYNLPICGSEKKLFFFFFFGWFFLFVWYFLEVIKDVFCKSFIPGKNSKKLLKNPNCHDISVFNNPILPCWHEDALDCFVDLVYFLVQYVPAAATSHRCPHHTPALWPHEGEVQGVCPRTDSAKLEVLDRILMHVNVWNVHWNNKMPQT